MKQFLLLAVIFLAGLGAFLAAGGMDADERGIWHRQRSLNILREDMADLASHLDRYKQAHGQYPDNDQGLAALDNFEARFRAPIAYERWGREASVFQDKIMEPWHRDKMLAFFRSENGRAEEEPEEFGSVRWPIPGEEGSETFEVDLAISADDRIHLLTPAGVLSPGMDLYFYENRTGLDAGKFAHSPVNDDPDGMFSREVAPGVYLYSTVGWAKAKEVRAIQSAQRRVHGVGLGMVALGVVGAVGLAGLGWRGLAVVTLLATSGAGALAAKVDLIGITCYVMGGPFRPRSQTTILAQRGLLDQYHNAGVISDEAYARSLSAIVDPLADPPAPATTSGPTARP